MTTTFTHLLRADAGDRICPWQSTQRNICVFCGSRSGVPDVGLMGVVADEVLARDGEIIGVMTEQLVGLEVAHQGLTELDVQPTMHRRKARMAELADGVVVLTGGFGTLDEAFELLTWNQLGLISVPIVFLDVDGFFAPLFDFIAGSAAAGFMKDHHGTLAQHTDNAEAAVRLASRNAPAFTPKWVDR